MLYLIKNPKFRDNICSIFLQNSQQWEMKSNRKKDDVNNSEKRQESRFLSKKPFSTYLKIFLKKY